MVDVVYGTREYRRKNFEITQHVLIDAHAYTTKFNDSMCSLFLWQFILIY